MARNMDSRRNFIGKITGGIAGTLAGPSAVLGANDRLRLGLIGAGDRGTHLAREALGCAGTELAAVADVYTRRIEQAAQEAPGVRTSQDYRELLEDPEIDAVIIATPQHLHAEQFIAAMQAGKHVYVERTMAFTAGDAQQMRTARLGAPNCTVQVGHQFCSSGLLRDAASFIAAGWVGTITAIRAHMYRNTPHGKAHWRRPVYPGMTPEHIQWEAFLGDAPRREFDANRYVNWRYFQDYGGGNVHEAMSQQIAFWYKILDLRIPDAVTMTGGTYLWRDGREVPDTMSVAMQHGDELLFTWDSGFGNNHLGAGEYVLGTDGTIHRSQQIRYWPEKVNRPGGRETLGRSRTAPRVHMQDFLDAVRDGREPSCPFEIGYRVSVACWMAVESLRCGRTVYWDAEREEIV